METDPHMSKKYELTSETMTKFGVTFRRVKALRDIPRFGVKKGDKGGWVDAEKRLDQAGDAWVYGDARVYGNARVSGNARVLVVTNIDGISVTVWREADGHGANWNGRRSVDDAELWLPESHKSLAPYLKARVAEWTVDEPDTDDGDDHAELIERLAKAEAEVAAVREALAV